MSPRAAAGLVLLLALASALTLLPRDDGGRAARPLPESELLDGSPRSCASCHAEVVDEWRQSMHAQAFVDPQVRAADQADDFRKTECLPCHAPARVFEEGIAEGSRVLARIDRRHDGVDCLACHGLPAGGMAASRSGLRGACLPVHEPRISTPALCAPCHDQHGTHAEWRASPAAAAGQACLDCHMPRVLRQGAEAGAPRAGRSHRFLGGRDRDFARPGLGLRAVSDRQAGVLAVTVENSFAGHNLPTDSRNRALDLVVTLFDARGVELPAAAVGDRHLGGESGTARLRFRNPYRSSGDPNSQIPAGETRTLEVPLPEGATRAVVELFYKLQPWIPDSEATWSERLEVGL